MLCFSAAHAMHSQETMHIVFAIRQRKKLSGCKVESSQLVSIVKAHEVKSACGHQVLSATMLEPMKSASISSMGPDFRIGRLRGSLALPAAPRSKTAAMPEVRVASTSGRFCFWVAIGNCCLKTCCFPAIITFMDSKPACPLCSAR